MDKNLTTILNPLVDCDEAYNMMLSGDTEFLEVCFKSVNHSINNNENSHIFGAIEFNLSDFSEKHTELPNMLPSYGVLINKVTSLNIKSKNIVLYEKNGVYASPRVFLMLLSIGYKNIFILNSSLNDWISFNYPISESIRKVNIKHINKEINNLSINSLFCDMGFVKKAILNSRDYYILDARDSLRYKGIKDEIRPGLLSGHIPNSINIPYEKFIEKGKFKNLKEIEDIFLQNNITDKAKNIICSCGSGITACIIALAAIINGYHKVFVYDGSWSEWGLAKLNNPIER